MEKWKSFILFVALCSCTINEHEGVVPAAPSDLAANLYSNLIKLKWKDNSNNELGFFIEKKSDPGNFDLLNTVNENITTYNVSISSSGTYTFRVYSWNRFGQSIKYSNESTIVIP